MIERIKKLDILFIQSIIISLIPFGLVTGPFIPDLLLSISSIIFVIITIKNKIFNSYINKFVVFFFYGF